MKAWWGRRCFWIYLTKLPRNIWLQSIFTSVQSEESNQNQCLGQDEVVVALQVSYQLLVIVVMVPEPSSWCNSRYHGYNLLWKQSKHMPPCLSCLKSLNAAGMEVSTLRSPTIPYTVIHQVNAKPWINVGDSIKCWVVYIHRILPFVIFVIKYWG